MSDVCFYKITGNKTNRCMPKEFFQKYYRVSKMYFASPVVTRVTEVFFFSFFFKPLAALLSLAVPLRLPLNRLVQNKFMLLSLRRESTHLINSCYALSIDSFVYIMTSWNMASRSNFWKLRLASHFSPTFLFMIFMAL